MRSQGASTLWKDREKPASGAAGLIAKARGDYRRLLATLYSQARYGGTISILIDGREAADLPPDAQLADPASVRVTINPGPLFHFGRAEIVNQAPPPSDPDDEVDWPERQIFLPRAELAPSGVVLQAERLSVEAWRQQGHAKAEVIERRVEAAHNNDTLDATLVVEPGPESRLRPHLGTRYGSHGSGFCRVYGRFAGSPGIRPRRHQTSEYAVGAPRRTSRSTNRGRRRDRGRTAPCR